MQPLEGFYYFTQVVDHGGFARRPAPSISRSRASRATSPRSRHSSTCAS